MINNEQTNGAPSLGVETEVQAKAKRRVFSPEYKRRIVEEVNQAPHGSVAKILRREGLYSTTVESWRTEIASAVESRKRGPKPSPDTQLRKDLEKLRRENERLKRKLEHATLIIDVQKKVAQMFNEPTLDSDEN